ncbi:MAG: hypothetical protein MJZ30_12020 [Paludibacteraceae bacterium]|nr:hypothetical protein [Paludibacteraceae bacterium]
MRRLLLGLFFCINVLLSYAEVPQGITYQSVIRNAYGALLPNSNIGIRVNILQEDGYSVYTENRRITTNENGVLTFVIGDAPTASSSIANIDWSSGVYYIQCDFDLDGGENYTLTLKSRVMSVPYALYAERISPQALPSWIDPDGKPAYSYEEIANTPRIPQRISELENDANYLTEHQSLEDYAKKSEIPSLADYATKAELQNVSSSSSAMIHDSLANYAKTTDLPNMANYATKEELPSLDGYAKTADIPSLDGYAKTTDIPSLTDYAKKSELPAVPTKVSELTNDANYLTEHQSLEGYAKKSDIPSLDDYATKAELQNISSSSSAMIHDSLSNYAKTTDLPNMADYATKEELPSLDGYAKTTDIPSLDGYAKTTDIPSLEGYAKTDDIPSLDGYAKTSDLDAYAKAADMADYAKTTDIPSLEGYAKTDDIPSLDGYAKTSDLEAYAKAEDMTDYAKTTDIPSTEGLLSTSDAANMYQPKGNYLTEHQSLTGYVRNSDLKDYALSSQLNSFAQKSELDNYVKKSELPNILPTDAFATKEELRDYVQSKDLKIPTKVSQLENDENFVKKSEMPDVEGLLSKSDAANIYQPKGAYLTQNDLSDYALKTSVPTKVSDLTDAQDYAKKSDVKEVPVNVSAFQNDANYITANELSELMSMIGGMQTKLDNLSAQNVALKRMVDSLSTVVDNVKLMVPIEYKRVAKTYSFSTSEFNDAATIYQGVKVNKGDRVIFVVRHSERNTNEHGKDGGLNTNGINILFNTAASKLKGAPFADASKDLYLSSNVKRTVETSYFIGKSRGADGCTESSSLSSSWEQETAVDHSGDVESGIEWIKKEGPHTYFNDHFTGGTDWYVARDYFKNNKSTCIEKCESAINWLAERSEGHPFTFVSSHDLCMVPFVCWATDNGNMFSQWNNDYDSNPSGWLMYMAGVAVIVHQDGTWEVYPVKCLDKGKFE